MLPVPCSAAPICRPAGVNVQANALLIECRQSSSVSQVIASDRARAARACRLVPGERDVIYMH